MYIHKKNDLHLGNFFSWQIVSLGDDFHLNNFFWKSSFQKTIFEGLIFFFFSCFDGNRLFKRRFPNPLSYLTKTAVDLELLFLP